MLAFVPPFSGNIETQVKDGEFNLIIFQSRFLWLPGLHHWHHTNSATLHLLAHNCIFVGSLLGCTLYALKTELGLDMWTFSGYLFCHFAVNSVNPSPTVAHSFPKEKLKTVESQLSDASQEQDPTCNGMARHGCVFGRCTVQTHDSQRSRVWPETLYVPFLSILSMFRFWYLCQTLHCASPFIEKRAIYIHHGVRAGWPSSTFHTAQDDVKRLRVLEEFAAYTLAIAKAEVGGMQIRMLYNCVLVSHKFLGRVSSCNCACVVGA